MSDDPRTPGEEASSTEGTTSDRWTQGPEVPPVKQQSEAQAGVASDDADTLRERQRLAQLEMMDRWMGGVLTEQRRSRRWKLFFRLVLLAGFLLIALSVAYQVFWSSSAATVPANRHVAVVDVNGVIASDAPANAERIIDGLNRAWDTDSAAAVVLHINSPGGSPVQSQRIYAEIMRLREQGDKPIIAVIEDIGASGAYYIASAADDIVASPVSLVGSIGVIYAGFGFQEAIDRVGVERRVMTAGENKAFLDPFQAMDEDSAVFWQGVLRRTHQQFIDDVKAGRGERLGSDPELFSGLVWGGEQAQVLGLIDHLGSMENIARERFNGLEYINYTPRLDPLERLTRRFAQTAAHVLGLQASQAPLRFQAP